MKHHLVGLSIALFLVACTASTTPTAERTDVSVQGITGGSAGHGGTGGMPIPTDVAGIHVGTYQFAADGTSFNPNGVNFMGVNPHANTLFPRGLTLSFVDNNPEGASITYGGSFTETIYDCPPTFGYGTNTTGCAVIATWSSAGQTIQTSTSIDLGHAGYVLPRGHFMYDREVKTLPGTPFKSGVFIQFM